MQRCFLFAPLCGAQAITALGARGVIAQARHMDGSQEQPCTIAGGQGQCEGRQAQRGPCWRAMQSPPGGFAQSLGGNLQPAQSERNFRKLFRHEVLEMRRI